MTNISPQDNVRSWTWHDRADGWLEHCVAIQREHGWSFKGMVVGSDFHVVYDLTYDNEGGRQDVICRLESGQGDARSLWIGNRGSAGTDGWSHRRYGAGADSPVPDVAAATDLDLAWTPLTNTLAVWRLDLDVGESQEFTVAWVQLPDLRIEPARQRYTRLDEHRYRYEGAEDFVADLTLDDEGFVVTYGDIWERRVLEAAGTTAN